MPHPQINNNDLLIACSSLISSTGSNGLPTPLIITNCLTPPQAYWIRYAQTEVVEVCVT